MISAVKGRNYKFIIYMDDLSFEEFEIEYKYLKAVIEGGFETRPDNILIYATSNRRHLIKESLSDRSDMTHDEDIHHSDTMEEKLSLVDRFGLNILYTKPTFDEYHTIVLRLAKKYGIDIETNFCPDWKGFINYSADLEVEAWKIASSGNTPWINADPVRDMPESVAQILESAGK